MFPLYDDNPHVRIPWLTILIILANLVIQWQVSQLPVDRQFEVFCHYGFIPARVAQLRNPQLVVDVERPMEELAGGQQPVPVQQVKLPADSGEIYLSLFTMMFLHGGWMHVIGNMWFLWIFGNNIEDRLGHLLFALFYVLGGLLAIAVQWAFHQHEVVPTVGASGAVAAILGAYAVTFPQARVRCLVFLVVIITIIDLPALLVLGFWFVQELYFAFQGQNQMVQSGVAFWAHVGGFVAGMVLMPLLSLGAAPPGSNWRAEAEEQFRFDSHRDEP